MALEHGIPTAPHWVGCLDAAAEWGQPPWVLFGGSSLIWFLRWRAYRSARISAEKKAAKEAKARR